MKKMVSVLLLLSMGCATIDRGPVQKVYIESEPAGAAVELEDCGRQPKDLRTPTDLFISRRVKRCTVHIALEGYEPARVLLQRRPAETNSVSADDVLAVCGPYGENCNSLWDLIIFGTAGVVFWGIGKGVDAAAGSNFELHPRDVYVELQPVATQRSEAPSAP